MFKKILLPVDGSKAGAKSYDFAKDLALKYDAEIVIFNAQALTPAFNWAYDPVVSTSIESSPEQIAERIVEDAKKFFDDSGIKVSIKTTVGDPANAILETIEDGDYDLAIMCTHGMSAGKRFLLGSVTNKVIHHATIPVLVVR